MPIPAILLASIFSGVASLASTKMASDASKEQADKARDAYNRETSRQRNKVQNWYNIRSNQDYTKRADQQAMFTKWRELAQERFKNTRATNVVAGGSEAELAAEKESMNKAIGDAMAQSAAASAANQDKLDQMYLGMDNQMSQNIANAAYQQGMQQAQQIAAAGGQASGAAVQMGGSLIEALAKKEWAGKKATT